MDELSGLTITKRLSVPNVGTVALVDCGPHSGADAARNIFFLGANDQVIWQIPPATLSHGVTGYSGISIGEKGDLLAYSGNGIEYRIDIETGAIISKELIR